LLEFARICGSAPQNQHKDVPIVSMVKIDAWTQIFQGSFCCIMLLTNVVLLKHSIKAELKATTAHLLEKGFLLILILILSFLNVPFYESKVFKKTKNLKKNEV
jgi:hypothetical protein